MKRFFTVGCIAFCLCFEPQQLRAQCRDLVPVNVEESHFYEFMDVDIWSRRAEIIKALSRNIEYLSGRFGRAAYARLQTAPITREAVLGSLVRFRELLLSAQSPTELRRALREEFVFYRPCGEDGRGMVRFTGYFQPIYRASRFKSIKYRYPIYRLPLDFAAWPKPHPTRVALEGYHGMGNENSPLKGRELAWLADRYEAFMIHVQGSALLEFENGERIAVGFAGNTDYPFRGFVSACLERKPKGFSIERFFKAYPAELDRCLAAHNRFIFFEEKPQAEAVGSLGLPILARFAVATDKEHLPPGALALARAQFPRIKPQGSIELVRTGILVLDQDSGGAIKGPGRADIYMGSGPEAGRLARAVYDHGELYYLLLKTGRSG